MKIVALLLTSILFICCPVFAGLKCQRLLGPEFSKVKTSFVSQIRQVSDILTLSEGVFDDTPV